MTEPDFEEQSHITPVIGIPCMRVLQENGAYRQITNSSYTDALVAAGAAPLLLPIHGSEEVVNTLYGLLLAGGMDINPVLYGEANNGSLEIDDIRDSVEMQFINLAIRDSKPILGICRGQQMLNVALGGSLYQDIPKDLPETTINHRINTDLKQRDLIAHPVNLESSSLLARIVEQPAIPVNSMHHQAVKNPGQNLKVTGYSPDGVIEALELTGRGKWVITVQCHPEELWQQYEWASKLFSGFATAARLYRSLKKK